VLGAFVWSIEMNSLIEINAGTIDGQVLDTVNARDLHAFLMIGDEFSHWIRDRIGQYGFIENQDFVTYRGKTQKGRPPTEYAITIDMAKELSMATTYLSEDARSQVGGIVKGIVNKAINEKLQTLLHLEEKMQGMIQTMATGMITNREIAELTGKDHKNVLADARKMLEELGQAAADFSATAQIAGPNNSTRSVNVLNLPKRETLILISGYNVQMRAKIIDRWQELEAKEQKSAHNSGACP
jgi:phage anti-repressor protein/phage regulator Rha-like protein